VSGVTRVVPEADVHRSAVLRRYRQKSDASDAVQLPMQLDVFDAWLSQAGIEDMPSDRLLAVVEVLWHLEVLSFVVRVAQGSMTYQTTIRRSDHFSCFCFRGTSQCTCSSARAWTRPVFSPFVVTDVHYGLSLLHSTSFCERHSSSTMDYSICLMLVTACVYVRH
jgi:hypothetical protein